MSVQKQLQNDPYFVEAGSTIQEQMRKNKERQEQKRKKENPTTNEYLFGKRTASDLPFIPEANSDIAITLYIVLIPYITGLIFLYFHLFKMDFGRMIALKDQHSFFLIWLIGYEVVAALILLMVFKSIIFSIFRPRVEPPSRRRYR